MTPPRGGHAAARRLVARPGSGGGLALSSDEAPAMGRDLPPGMKADVWQSLRDRLAEAGFAGDIALDTASRFAASTDNSVYRIVPDIVVAPRDAADTQRLLRVLDEEPFHGLAVTARGGGTGTNGQALNRGVVVDFRRHMNRILRVDAQAGWVEVEPGIVLDDLNEQLAGTGLFFAPSTSTANRCTIGGMIATDASGKGSRLYGKTGDNVLGLELMLAGGRVLDSAEKPAAWAENMLRAVARACDSGRPALLERIPHLSRRFTGYDLERARPASDRLDWWRLPIGAEGTLGLVTRARLKLVRIPRHKSLLVLAFARFAEMLDATAELLKAEPVAIEVIDEWVQSLAGDAGLLSDLPPAIRGAGKDNPVLAFVELAGDEVDVLERQADQCLGIAGRMVGFRGAHRATAPAEIRHLWTVRSACVGLLGAAKDTRKPISFVEDCVVPPQSLSAFVTDFATILSRHGISYGIYGHADVGCLHTRPALDIHSAHDRRLYKQISDEVFAAVTAPGGIFWGEHGKGIRGEYLEAFVGPQAYAAFRAIKAAFDPGGRFNPGKLVAGGGELYGVASAPMRSAPASAGDVFAQAFACNGNALCLTYAATTPMCPSFKVSRELRHSPKGRAEALQAWRNARDDGTATDAMEAEVFEALDGCLGCKSCAGSCPTHVDIPELKSHFLQHYHRHRRRSPGDAAAIALERFAPLLCRVRPLLRAFAATGIYRHAAQALGIVDPPVPSRYGLKQLGFRQVSHRDIHGIRAERDQVLLLQDPFSALFDTAAVAAIARGLATLGYTPLVLEPVSGGKAAHAKGDRAGFVRQAVRLASLLRSLEETGMPIIGTDPAFIYMLRSEYPKAGFAGLPKVWSVEEYLVEEMDRGRVFPRAEPAAADTIFLHCTEQAMRPRVGDDWRRLMRALGIEVLPQSTGCCGMSGSFGHEGRHADWSRKLFDLSWRKPVEAAASVYATGFSCRCQVERFADVAATHPMELIALRLEKAKAKHAIYPSAAEVASEASS